jgi:manganese/zinc/iron transport system substrate-binding protein
MRKIYIMCMIAVAAALLLSCGKKQEKDEADVTEEKKRLEIVTTTGMIADIVRNIGGEAVNVTALMGPGVDPHLYKASEGDVGRMANADIIFYNGLHLEGAMADVFSKLKGKAFAVTKGIDRSMLIQPEEFEGVYDPHVWFDVRMWMMAVEFVRDKLIEHDRASAVIFDTETQAYLQQLAELHDYVFKLARTVPEKQRVLITAHDAFNYFGRSYGFQVMGLQGISTASEAGAADVQKLAQIIADRRIPAIFVETSVPDRSIKAVQAAVKAKGFDVKIGGYLYSDAMGTEGTAAGSYIGMVTHNIETIVNALHGGRESNLP